MEARYFNAERVSPYAKELVVLAITSGSTISILLSPLIMPVIVLSSENGLSSLKNGIRFNWKYAVVIYVLVQAYVQTKVRINKYVDDK
ncbi:hypothetical protein [Oceanobacillus caeni]|uniref:ABC transmembrane type-1 domain-containing protein n=1 Tax=Oceanobacillus caeni TaxID=405946 RepID=A0ABR5MMF2_9BACI|nr:hypothetical protein [Oceanobacillus caeni]KPH77834.1 hypothetical protein AFL42_02430 [Oceanobacillus caeni]MBU8789296.1 hypothetical protein [Oceanobacillus caeni]